MKVISRVDVWTGGQWVFSTITPQASANLIRNNTKLALVIHGII